MVDLDIVDFRFFLLNIKPLVFTQFYRWQYLNNCIKDQRLALFNLNQVEFRVVDRIKVRFFQRRFISIGDQQFQGILMQNFRTEAGFENPAGHLSLAKPRQVDFFYYLSVGLGQGGINIRSSNFYLQFDPVTIHFFNIFQHFYLSLRSKPAFSAVDINDQLLNNKNAF